jgi:chorismate dehydratase
LTEKELRIGRIRYLNVLPIYYPMESGVMGRDFKLVYGAPAELNDMMARGELHVASASSVEYARHADQYYLVPDIAIGSCGPVMSVLLISRKPIWELEGETVLTTAQSHTSACLLRMLFRDYLKINVQYETGSVMESIESGDLPTAALCIGDDALRLRSDDRYPYRMDLGEAWREWTGLPFIFGVWVISRKAVEEGCFNRDPATLFIRAKDWGVANMEQMVSMAADTGYLSKEDMRTYFTKGLVYNLRAKEQEGLRLFYRRLAEAGEIPAAPELVFYDHATMSPPECRQEPEDD